MKKGNTMEESQKKKIVVLGSTGSIGLQTLDIVRQHPDKLQVVGLSVYGDVDTVLAQAHEFGVKNVALGRYMLKNDARITEFPGRATITSFSSSGERMTRRRWSSNRPARISKL